MSRVIGFPQSSVDAWKEFAIVRDAEENVGPLEVRALLQRAEDIDKKQLPSILQRQLKSIKQRLKALVRGNNPHYDINQERRERRERREQRERERREAEIERRGLETENKQRGLKGELGQLIERTPLHLKGVKKNDETTGTCWICSGEFGNEPTSTCCENHHLVHNNCALEYLDNERQRRRNPLCYCKSPFVLTRAERRGDTIYGRGKLNIKQIKAHLKELKIKGVAGKNKEQLMAMLVKGLCEKRGSGMSDIVQKILNSLIHSNVFKKAMEKFGSIGDSEQYHGAGIGSWISNAVNVIRNPTSALTVEPKQVKDMLVKYGDNIVRTINVCRVPISSMVQLALNAITLGKFKKEMVNNGYDKMFHLYALLTLNNGVVLITERNQRVVLKVASNSQKKAKDIMTVVCNKPLNQLINNAVKLEGSAIWKYDPINNNCQRYISSLLKASGLFNESLNTFINQKADKLLEGKSHSLSTGITNIANIAENLARGGNEIFGSGNKSSGFIRAIMARNNDPENAKMNKSKFRNLDKQGMRVDKMSKATHDVIKKKVKDPKYKEYLIHNALQHQPLSDGNTNYRGTYDMGQHYVKHKKEEGKDITESRKKKIEEAHFDNMFESKLKMSKPTPRKRPQVKSESNNGDILTQLEKIVSEGKEASKEGKLFKSRDNWKGKAGYMKKIDALWDKYDGGSDRFYAITWDFGWKPKNQQNEPSHASKMYEKHGIQID